MGEPFPDPVIERALAAFYAEPGDDPDVPDDDWTDETRASLQAALQAVQDAHSRALGDLHLATLTAQREAAELGVQLAREALAALRENPGVMLHGYGPDVPPVPAHSEAERQAERLHRERMADRRLDAQFERGWAEGHRAGRELMSTLLAPVELTAPELEPVLADPAPVVCRATVVDDGDTIRCTLHLGHDRWASSPKVFWDHTNTDVGVSWNDNPEPAAADLVECGAFEYSAGPESPRRCTAPAGHGLFRSHIDGMAWQHSDVNGLFMPVPATEATPADWVNGT